MGFFGFLQAALILLKLTGLIDISWWWIPLPGIIWFILACWAIISHENSKPAWRRWK